MAGIYDTFGADVGGLPDYFINFFRSGLVRLPENSGPAEYDRQAVGFFVEEVLVGLLAVFGLVGGEDAVYVNASFPKPTQGAGEVFEDTGGPKVFGLAGEFPFPAASDDGVIVEDGGV